MVCKILRVVISQEFMCVHVLLIFVSSGASNIIHVYLISVLEAGANTLNLIAVTNGRCALF